MAILREFYFCEIPHPQSFAKIKPCQNFRIYSTFKLSSAKRASCIPLHKLEQTECPDTLFTLSSANTASCSPLKSYSQQNVQILYLHYLVSSEQAVALSKSYSQQNVQILYLHYLVPTQQAVALSKSYSQQNVQILYLHYLVSSEHAAAPPQSRANRMSRYSIYTILCHRSKLQTLHNLEPTECPYTLFTLSSVIRACCSPLHNLEPTECQILYIHYLVPSEHAAAPSTI